MIQGRQRAAASSVCMLQSYHYVARQLNRPVTDVNSERGLPIFIGLENNACNVAVRSHNATNNSLFS